jgi:outer membrane biosynthesis protein TonB
VPDRRSIFRLLALAGFLLTVALALWLAELRPLLVIIVMGVALLVAWTVEWLSWRQDQLRRGSEGVEVEEDAIYAPLLAPPPGYEPASEPGSAAPVSQPAPEQPAEPAVAPVPAEADAAAPDSEPAPAQVPEPVPVAVVAPAPPVPVPEPQAVPEPPSPEPAPEPARPVLRPVPSPPAPAVPTPAPPADRPVRPAADAPAGVVDLRTRVTVQPRHWNLWDLERRARDEAQRDPLRYEEWSYLFVHLRQFATPDGSLPVEFDDLVRESFGELLEHAGR